MSSRLLGIDFGTARIGLALSDELGLLARPLETVPAGTSHPHSLDRIARAVADHGVAAIVLGVPYLLDGRSGEAARRALAFAETLRKRFPNLPVHLVDERLSTVEARRLLQQSRRPEAGIRALLDQTAAAAILQDYLNHSGGDPPLLPPPPDEPPHQR
ncbi:MAG TPA: Holliday junction resolvase RuvX [Verrucomicrobiales bacterium]|nr:Holliday junction resolvase RuvX [Verrucomicrobiales bacterium]